MERLVKEDAVVVRFPFIDLSGEKKRPSIVIKEITGNDFVLCQITKHSFANREEVAIRKKDFSGRWLKAR